MLLYEDSLLRSVISFIPSPLPVLISRRRTVSVGQLLDVSGEALDGGPRVGVLAEAEVDLSEEFVVDVLRLFRGQHQLLAELLDLTEDREYQGSEYAGIVINGRCTDPDDD